MKNVPWWCKFHDVTTLFDVSTSKTSFHMKCEKLKICKISWYTITNKNTSAELLNEGRYTGITELLLKGKLAIIKTVWIGFLWTDFFLNFFPLFFFKFYVLFSSIALKHILFSWNVCHTRLIYLLYTSTQTYLHTYTIHNRRYAQLTSTAAQLLYESKKEKH